VYQSPGLHRHSNFCTIDVFRAGNALSGPAILILTGLWGALSQKPLKRAVSADVEPMFVAQVRHPSRLGGHIENCCIRAMLRV